MARTAKACSLEVAWDTFGRPRVRGPVVRMTELPLGATDKHGDPITSYTPSWARIGYEPMSPCVKLEGARQSGHGIEGYVRIRGKRYSAFVEGGDAIVVRTRK